MFDWFRRIRTRLMGDRYRREHSAWLTRATRDQLPYPRIPRAEVRRGGFDSVRATRAGRLAAEWWWVRAFQETQAIDRTEGQGPTDRRAP